ncbi:mitochondrial amidoxime reducing component 2-like [Penaeus japonicus]|uniref:mitochondrial amidoxime reducing component 2-like n=1 Tax=Penaeus japonicus TaxID=27405 RepID=UPI001C715D09|nr:mitochondrial amidoxime reducing component 2-like [Penaeus japonicus]
MRINTPTGQVAVGVGVGVGALLAWWAYRRSTANQLPTRWEEVGVVSRLNVYPLKSGRPVSVAEAEATERGLATDGILDRSFLVKKKDGLLMTGRQLPKLTRVTINVKGHKATFESPDNPASIEVDLEKVAKEGKVVELIVFGANAKGLDCGDEVAAWMSQAVSEGKTEVRLLYNGDDILTRRAARRAPYYDFKHIRDSDKVTYADTCAYMLASESSLADLNGRLAEPVTIDWFRANVVVKGSAAYDEDDWAFVRIGGEGEGGVVLRRLKPCDRCIFTTVDPYKGCKTADQEPMTTLRKYRLLNSPEKLAKAWEIKPVFGSHMGIDVCGTVKVGDKIWVARASSNPKWSF